MNRRSLQIGVLVAVVAGGSAIAIPADAIAPKAQYDFFVAQDRRIKDAKTKLTWERSVSVTTIKFSEAVALCAAPLRLPTLKELLTLVDEDPHFKYEVNKNVTKFIDREAFDGSAFNTPVDATYWTSSMSDASNAWTVNFATGGTSTAGINDGRYARCVRYTP